MLIGTGKIKLAHKYARWMVKLGTSVAESTDHPNTPALTGLDGPGSISMKFMYISRRYDLSKALDDTVDKITGWEAYPI